MADDLGSMVVSFVADLSGLEQGVAQAAQQLNTVEDAATKMAQAFTSVPSYNAGNAITDVDVAQAKLTLIESKVNESRAELQKLQGAADAGQAVTGIPEATANLVLLERSAQEARAQLQELQNPVEPNPFLTAIGSMGAGLLNFVNTVGNTIQNLQMLGQTAMWVSQQLLGPAAQAEQTGVAFDTLMGNTKAATDELSKLNDFAAKTPFQTQDIDDAAEKMIAFGFNTQSVIPDITAIGDSLSALGKSSPAYLSNMVDLFGKIQASGKLTSVDMLQMSSYGIPAWKMLSEQMGIPVTKLQDMVSKGLVPADVAIKGLKDGMEKTFGGGMAKQADTLNGQMSTLQSNATMAWNAFLGVQGGQVVKGSLFDMVEQGLGKIGNMLSNPAFQKFAATMGKDVGESIQKAGAFLSGTLLPPLDHLGEALTPIVKPMADWAVKNDILGKSMKGLGDGVGLLVKGLGETIDDVAKVVEFFEKNQVAGDILIGVMAGLVVGIIAFNANALIAAIVSIPAIVIGWGAWAIGALAAAAATLAAIWPFILIGAIVAAVVVGIILAIQHWGAITNWFHVMWIMVWTAVSVFFEKLWYGMVDNVEKAMGWIGDKLQQAGKGLYDLFIQPFVDGYTFISNIFGGIGKLIEDVTHGNFTALAGDLHSLGIPGFAGGVQNFGGGLAMVGENGPELVSLPRGSSVYSNSQTSAMLSGGGSTQGGDQTIYVMLDSEVLAQAIGQKQQRLIYLRTGVSI